MKKTILLALIALCNLLKASDFQLELPVYDPFTHIPEIFSVDLDQKDPFTQCTFRDLMQRNCIPETLDYQITVFRCFGLSGLAEFAVADTKAFYSWIARNGKVDPVTRKIILAHSSQNFIIRPTENTYHIIPVYYQVPSSVLETDKKRKREDNFTNDDFERIFIEIQAEKEARRAKELEFLRSHD